MPKNILSNILLPLQQKIGTDRFAFAFSSVEQVSLQDNILIIGVPADFLKLTIENNHLESLKQIAQQEANIEDVKIVVSDQKNAIDFFSSNTITNTATPTPTTHAKPAANTNQATDKDSALRESFNFDNFVVGPSNKFAHTVSIAIAENPGRAHNPCLIYGDVGLGKTHLIQAIGNKIKKENPNSKILYYPCEKFLNDFFDSLQNNNNPREFKNKIRSADVLLIDDIQFLSGKPASQEEFFHTFNTLSNEEKQMVFTSDRQIHRIQDLEERLQSRFRSSMMVDLSPPEPEVARGIIDKVLQEKKITDISAEVLQFVVDRMRFNIRDMLGVVNRIVGYQNLTESKIDIPLMQKWHAEYTPKRDMQKSRSLDKILSKISAFYNIPISEIKGKKRTRSIARIRHIAVYLLKEHTKHSHTEIGTIFNLSHVSASKAFSRIEEERKIDIALADELLEIEEKIYQNKDFE